MHAIIRLFLGLVFCMLLSMASLSLEEPRTTGVRCKAGERQALLQLKQGFMDPNDMLSDWDDGEHKNECCNWTRIQCSNKTNHVVLLDLHGTCDPHTGEINQSLQGNISSSLTKLHHLTHLNLSFNDFDGTQIPEFIGSLTHLRYLGLAYSNFGGSIPIELANLSGLHVLDLRWNYLNGEIPYALGGLSSLEQLHLGGNSLGGVIPSSFRNLSNLMSLDVGGNSEMLKSSLEWLPCLSSLQKLGFDLVNLSTSDTWLQMLNNLPHLTSVELNNCSLPSVGLSSVSLSNSSKSLKHLAIRSSDISGPIPEVFGNMSSLECLYLDGNNFTGKLPNSLCDLYQLSILSLSNNDFKGRLDEFLLNTTMPCLNKSLQTLYLDSNRLTGSVPDLSLFTKLQWLSLPNNELHGTFSESIGQLSNLQGLVVSSNALKGALTEAHFSKLSKLTVLDISNTLLVFNASRSWVPPFQLEYLNLRGSKLHIRLPEWIKTQPYTWLDMSDTGISDIPECFGGHNSTNAFYVDLSHNKMEGEIQNLPIQFSNSPIIDLSSNQLKGEIPTFLFGASTLNLSRNMFSGSISSLCSVTQVSPLTLLDLSYNKLSGKLSDCWSQFKHLVYLDLSHNKFSGDVPPSLLPLPNLQAVHLQNNNFQRLPSLSSSNDLMSAWSLDLSDNELSGLLPVWVGDRLANLRVLSLRNNKFYGSLPSSICNLTQIQVFDLSANNLSGSFPKCFNKFVALSNLSSDDDQGYYYQRYFPGRSFFVDFTEHYQESMIMIWKGQMHEFKEISRFHRFIIDLSKNQLTGQIPSEIMDFIGLISLNLSWNSLSGKIGPEIGRLQKLESLDLSNNHLHGPIPPSLSQLYSLSKFNLSFNNLSGEIPTGPQLQTLNDASSYFGNPDLCGPPLNIMCPYDGKDNGQTDVTDQEDDEMVDLLLTHGIYIFTTFGFFVGFWASCGSLIFCKSWRYAFFNFCTRVCDKIYVKIAISVNKLRRNFQQ